MDRNELDPSVPSATEVKKIPLIIKVYAVLCILSGVGTLPSVGAFMWQVITALINGNAAAKLGDNTLVAVGLIVVCIMLSAASAVILIIFGLDLIKNQRRNAARLSYILIALTVVELLVDVMLQGIGPSCFVPLFSSVSSSRFQPPSILRFARSANCSAACRRCSIATPPPRACSGAMKPAKATSSSITSTCSGYSLSAAYSA
ncbi:MAG: hypothetical protein ACLRM9_01965 [Collinsella aerofaciens]